MHITAINRTAALAITDTGVACSVSQWIDVDGEEAADRDAAVVAIVPLPNGKWEAVDLREFDVVAVN